MLGDLKTALKMKLIFLIVGIVLTVLVLGLLIFTCIKRKGELEQEKEDGGDTSLQKPLNKDPLNSSEPFTKTK